MDTRHQYDELARLYAPIGVAVLVLVIGAFFFVLWRYRAGRPGQAGGPSRGLLVEGAWIVVVAGVVAVLVVATLRTERRIDARAAAPALRVTVTAAKWEWVFGYAGGAQLRNEVVVPAGRTVRFEARSLDVLHDFWVPDLRFQRQVWPEHVERFDLVFRRPGTYQGVCAWFCGLHHQNMHFVVRALGAGAFAAWASRSGAA